MAEHGCWVTHELARVLGHSRQPDLSKRCALWTAGAPLVITADLVNTFNISLVVRGSVSETDRANDGDRYTVPRGQNIFR